ncbi:MAG: hypothetical protein ACE5IK_14045, partial [Acidobacteriota bacterium]
MRSEPATGQRTDLIGHDRASLERIMARIGEAPFRARQIYRWMYGREAQDFETMTDLPQALRRKLAERFSLHRPEPMQVQDSTDGTRKYLLSLREGGKVESVYMPESGRITLCISAQIGCALDCRFCLTARLGLVRNLSAGEILTQVIILRRENRDQIGTRPLGS